MGLTPWAWTSDEEECSQDEPKLLYIPPSYPHDDDDDEYHEWRNAGSWAMVDTATNSNELHWHSSSPPSPIINSRLPSPVLSQEAVRKSVSDQEDGEFEPETQEKRIIAQQHHFLNIRDATTAASLPLSPVEPTMGLRPKTFWVPLPTEKAAGWGVNAPIGFNGSGHIQPHRTSYQIFKKQWSKELAGLYSSLRLDEHQYVMLRLASDDRVAVSSHVWSPLGLVSLALADTFPLQTEHIRSVMFELVSDTSGPCSLPCAVAYAYLSAVLDVLELSVEFTSNTASTKVTGCTDTESSTRKALEEIPIPFGQGVTYLAQKPPRLSRPLELTDLTFEKATLDTHTLDCLLSPGTLVWLRFTGVYERQRGVIVYGSVTQTTLTCGVMHFRPRDSDRVGSLPLSLGAALSSARPIFQPADRSYETVQSHAIRSLEIVDTEKSFRHIVGTASAMQAIHVLAGAQETLRDYQFGGLLFRLFPPWLIPFLLREWPQNEQLKNVYVGARTEGDYRKGFVAQTIKSLMRLGINVEEAKAQGVEDRKVKEFLPFGRIPPLVNCGGTLLPHPLTALANERLSLRWKALPKKLFNTSYNFRGDNADCCEGALHFQYHGLRRDLMTLLTETGGTMHVARKDTKYKGWLVVAEDGLRGPVIATTYAVCRSVRQIKKGQTEVAYETGHSLAAGLALLEFLFIDASWDDHIDEENRSFYGWPLTHVVVMCPGRTLPLLQGDVCSRGENSGALILWPWMSSVMRENDTLKLVKKWWSDVSFNERLNLEFRSLVLRGAANIALAILLAYKTNSPTFQINLSQLPTMNDFGGSSLTLSLSDGQVCFTLLWWVIFFIRFFGPGETGVISEAVSPVGDGLVNDSSTRKMTALKAVSQIYTWCISVATQGDDDTSTQALDSAVSSLTTPMEVLAQTSQGDFYNLIVKHSSLILTCPLTNHDMRWLIQNEAEVQTLIVEKTGPPKIHDLIEACVGRASLKRLILNHHISLDVEGQPVQCDILQRLRYFFPDGTSPAPTFLKMETRRL
eukprot:Blabericola_migrator_1__12586@NODE_7_length_25668_cov_124_338502_g6_i0_p2_GENE_NODE_7_length_25668_cov_124_338502_g6_i0NODE_7_length_25668_cov_124_338502_g6_i0_p2_ORF_typecomplete_len1023_score170_93DUF3473/PF11959_8/0_38_NODE_7_length_25668_cov_124_338502_g6_i01616919237